MRYKEFLLAVLFMISATTMRVYAAPDCAEILKYRGEVTRPAVYTANEDTLYKVEHYLQDVEGDEYTLYEVTEHTGTSDTEAIVHPMSKQGWKGVAGHPENTLSGNINADGSGILKVYYDRETFSVKYLDKDGNLLENRTVRFGGKSILPEPPSLDGYDFNGCVEKP